MIKKTTTHKLMAVLLTLIMVLGIMPIISFADTQSTEDNSVDTSTTQVIGILKANKQIYDNIPSICNDPDWVKKDDNTYQKIIYSTDKIKVDYSYPCGEDIKQKITEAKAALNSAGEAYAALTYLTYTAPSEEYGPSYTDYETDNRKYSWYDVDSKDGDHYDTPYPSQGRPDRYMVISGDYGRERTYTIEGELGYAPHIPDAPTFLSTEIGSGIIVDGKVKLDWIAPANDGGSPITDYEYSTDDGATWHSCGSTATTYMVTGLTNGQYYKFRVRAVNAIGKSAPSNRSSNAPVAGIYDITVTDGTSSEEFAQKDTVITITAKTAPAGKEFDKWEVLSGGVILDDATSTTTTFTMPANNVSVKATYKDIIVPHTHSGVFVPEVPATEEATGTQAYYECDCGKLFSDEACTNEVNVADLTIPKLAPTLVSGNNGKFIKDSTTGLTFKSSAALADLTSVSVDGTVIAKANYTEASGSTIITLKPEYLNTLSVGEHTLTITSSTGSVEAKFKVEAKATTTPDDGAPATPGDTNPNTGVPADTTSPQTGDDSNIFLWVALMFVAGIGVVATTVLSKKKRYN